MRSGASRLVTVAAALAIPVALAGMLQTQIGLEGEAIGAGAAASTPSPASSASASARTKTPHGGAPHHTTASTSSGGQDAGGPTIAAVLPSVGLAGDVQKITLVGTGFGEARDSGVTVLFGPEGASGGDAGEKSDHCEDAHVLSDRVLQCTVPSWLPPGRAERFIVFVSKTGASANMLSSAVSTATYTPLPPATVTRVDAPRCGGHACDEPALAAGTLMQIHLTGWGFDSPDAGATTVYFLPRNKTGAEEGTQESLCQPVQVLGPNDIVCYLPQSVYDGSIEDTDGGRGRFVVRRAGLEANK